jgi:hypothetical protein
MRELPIKRQWGYRISACVLINVMALCTIGPVTSIGVRAVLEQRPMMGGWTWLTIILVDLFTLSAAVYLCHEPLVQLRTRFTEEGVSRRSWFRSRTMRWQEIQAVDNSFTNTVKLVTEASTISINLSLQGSGRGRANGQDTCSPRGCTER